ncbi:MAG: tetratricopeptide repeat protein [Brevinema sp.]
MDLMLVALSFFTIVITSLCGYWVIHTFFPNRNRELEVIKAFKESDYNKVVLITKGKEFDSKNSFDVYNFTGQAQSHLGNHTKAIKWWNLALTKLDLSPEDKIFLELKIGDEFCVLKDYKTAEIHYRTAVALSPKKEQPNHKLAQVLYYQDQFEHCRKTLRPLLKTNPSLIDSRKLYAECLASLKLYTKAIRHYGLLERINELSITYHYAQTLKQLKIWDKAYETYYFLLENPNEEIPLESIIIDLVQVCISMKKYHQGLDFINQYLPKITSPKLVFDLKYIRANMFFEKGDQMIALQEFTQMYKENMFYKDLKSIVEQNEHWLTYPFLFNYFTSNEKLFEVLITRLAPIGVTIIRRSSLYYLCVKDDSVYVFYRDIGSIVESTFDKIETAVYQYCPSVEKLELWTLGGVPHTVTGRKYRLIVRSGDDFLVQTNIIVSQMEHLEGGGALDFVQGFQGISEVIPKMPLEDSNPQFVEDHFILTK